MSLSIEKPGLLTTIQDIGRIGYGQYGISRSGAMDGLAHRLANWLVGNPDHAATLEMTWSGMTALVEQDCWIAITGSDMQPCVHGKPVPMWRPVFVSAGSRLLFKQSVSGCRAYIGIAGGWQGEQIMGSTSTYLRAGLGGLDGRPLQAGDKISAAQSYSGFSQQTSRQAAVSLQQNDVAAVNWRVSANLIPQYGKQAVIRVLPGRQWEDFDGPMQQMLLEQEYRITPQSDRMGYRLSGSELQTMQPQQYISEAVSQGTVQVPPDGQPIILMADRQTLGGYAKIAQVISLDLPRLAQMAPGDQIHFQLIDMEEAQRLYVGWVRELAVLRRFITMKLNELGLSVRY
ncbi:biotin-dependent carboxyltransferase family protein [Paenibacillus sp. WLX2291]|uniref:5-oxoprolinase subunit C family protein n=1 Tax=Paenibacillus sp. WLX2291 TaxID=3296934 RepID=UPI003984407E